MAFWRALQERGSPTTYLMKAKKAAVARGPASTTLANSVALRRGEVGLRRVRHQAIYSKARGTHRRAPCTFVRPDRPASRVTSHQRPLRAHQKAPRASARKRDSVNAD